MNGPTVSYAGLADVLLPVVIAIFVAVLAGACSWLCREHRPQPGTFRYLFRLAWYRLTLSRRMPGRCPRRDLYRLSDADRAEFGGMVIILREEGACGSEPSQADERRPK